MIYGDRVKYAREKLGINRMQLAVLLETTQQNIANVENCRDGSRKLGWEKMQKLIDTAELPKGYFFYDDDEFLAIVVGRGTDDVYVKAVHGGSMLNEELEDVLEIIKHLPRKI